MVSTATLCWWHVKVPRNGSNGVEQEDAESAEDGVKREDAKARRADAKVGGVEDRNQQAGFRGLEPPAVFASLWLNSPGLDRWIDLCELCELLLNPERIEGLNRRAQRARRLLPVGAASVSELGGFGDGEEFVDGLEAGEVVSAAAIEHRSLDKINVEEPQGGAEGEAGGESPEAAALADVRVLQDRGVMRGQGVLQVQERFPVGVAVVLLDKDADRRKGIVVHHAAETAGSALEKDVLVDLVVTAVRGSVHEVLEASEVMFEEAEIPVGEVRVFQPGAHEPQAAVDPIALVAEAVLGDDGGEFLLGGRREDLVGVEDEDPFVAKRDVFEGPVFLFWPGSVEVELDDLGAGLLANFDGAVGALGVDHHDLIGPGDGGEAPRQVGGFILDRNEDADGDFGHGGVGKTEPGRGKCEEESEGTEDGVKREDAKARRADAKVGGVEGSNSVNSASSCKIRSGSDD